MSELIKIVYVGKKPTAYDNVAKTGKVWHGHGDIQEVTTDQAKLLLKHPDQWDVVDLDDADIVNTETITKVIGEDGESVRVTNAELVKPLEKMTKAELVALAKAKWGKDLEATENKKLLIDAIEEFERYLEPIAALT